MSYLVTGGAGFVGSNFIRYILEDKGVKGIIIVDKLTYAGNKETLKDILEDKRVTFIKGDICDESLMKEVFLKNNIEVVVNFAAESHVDRSISDSKNFLLTNILGVENLLKVARDSWKISEDKKGYPVYKDGVKFIQISTDEVYGELSIDFSKKRFINDLEKYKNFGLSGYVYGEKLFNEKSKIEPKSPYSSSKGSGDILTMSYYHTYHLPIIITRCTNNFGPYQHPEKLIPKVISNILDEKDIPIYGSGNQVRDWIDVTTHSIGIKKVLESGRTGEVYNIGVINELKNIELIKMIIDIMKELKDNGEYEKNLLNIEIGYDKIKYVKDRLGHDRRYGINPRKIVEEVGFEVEVDFKVKLKETIKWYLENRDWIEEMKRRSR